MSIITLIEQAKESAKREFADSIARRAAVSGGSTWEEAEALHGYKAEAFSETLSTGQVVSCIGTCASNAGTTTIGHIRMNWKLDGKRISVSEIEALYNSLASPEQKAELKKFKESQAWLKKFGL